MGVVVVVNILHVQQWN